MIKIDQATDQLLEEIAAAKEPTPELLRKIVPDRKAFVSYLKERGLLEDETAQSLLKSVDAGRQAARKWAAGKKKKKKGSEVTPAAVAMMVNKIIRQTGFKGADIRRVLHELLTPTGRLTPRWHERVVSLLRKKRREAIEAQSGDRRNKSKRKLAARKARRRIK